MSDTEENIRQLIGENMAYRMALEIVLAHVFVQMGESERRGLVDAINRRSLNTEHLAGTAPDDMRAEFVSDVTVRAQSELAALLDAAMRRAAAGT